MTAVLEYCGHFLKIANFVYESDDPEPYNCSFDLLVKSGLWAGCAVGCECGYKAFRSFVGELSELYDFRRSEVLFDAGFDNVLRFGMNEMGHLSVSGLIYGNARECCMQFRFEADQTVLRDFIGQLRKMTGERNGYGL